MTTQPTTATAAPDLDLAIEVSGLTKRFGERTVIDNVVPTGRARPRSSGSSWA